RRREPYIDRGPYLVDDGGDLLVVDDGRLGPYRDASLQLRDLLANGVELGDERLLLFDGRLRSGRARFRSSQALDLRSHSLDRREQLGVQRAVDGRRDRLHRRGRCQLCAQPVAEGGEARSQCLDVTAYVERL